jgi:glycosyl hydrolase group 75 (putative chitosanase)
VTRPVLVSWLLACCLCSALAVMGAPSGDAKAVLARAKPVQIAFSDKSTAWQDPTLFVGRLENGLVVVKSRSLALDTDGASQALRACDATSQADTALHDPEGQPIDANAIPYYVLPWCGGAADHGQCQQHPPYQQLGLQLGNVAAVIVRDKIAYAIAADLGPEKQFGEGSIALHRQLGHETVGKDAANPRCAKNDSLEAEVIFVIFPASNFAWLAQEAIAQQGAAYWTALRRGR